MADERCKGGYKSQLIAMIGTVFLFIYWPSFNAALAVGLQQQRAIVNTLLSITASCLVAVFASRLDDGKIDMEVLINATLAGGVVMGAACDLIPNPGFAMICGAVAGAISCLGFLMGQKNVKEKLFLHDTCGVTFLHGIPGLIGGFVSAICAGLASYNFQSKKHLSQVMPGMTTRTAQEQACF